MSFKNIVHGLKDMKDGLWNISRKRAERKKRSNRAVSRIVPDVVLSDDTIEGPWANLPPKLLMDIIRRVEESETSWPARSVIVSCASVCKPWREITKQIVKTPEECGRLTFPISLKQPGPRESPIKCFIKRDRANSVYRLYFGMTPSEDATDKLLLAAKKTRRVTSIDFVISLVADNFSQASNTYVGKLRSNNFLGTKFDIYDTLPPSNAAFQQHGRRFHGKQVSARVPACDYKAATVSYEVIGFLTPRIMHCAMHSIPLPFDEKSSTSTPLSKAKDPGMDISSSDFSRTTETMTSHEEPLVLKNKAPLWHEKGKFWYLDFKDRAIKTSGRNFQLLAAVDDASQEKVILQFGKIGEDIFAMDYNYPLSAFQAFAICLTILGSIRVL